MEASTTLWDTRRNVFSDTKYLRGHGMQGYSYLLSTVSTQIKLNVNRSKTKIMRANTTNINPVTLRGEPLEETNSCMYQGSIFNKSGGTEENVKVRIQKTRVALLILRKIWKTKQIKLKIKLRSYCMGPVPPRRLKST